jgi:tRNA(Arg) A34 adenosine deaminase TadA
MMVSDMTAQPDERFLRRAIELSRHGMEAGDGGPFGAVVVRGVEVIGEGWNRVVCCNDPTAHAEVEAIRAACRRLGTFRLSGCVLYASAEPCPMCLAAIYWARIDRIVFAGSAADAAAIGFDDALFYEQLGRAPDLRQVPQVQMLREEALAVMRDYAANPDRVRY